MNYSIIIHILGKVIGLEGIFFLLPFMVGLLYKESEAYSFLIMSIFSILLGYFMQRRKPKNSLYFTKEGMTVVAFSWIIMSILGAMPFVINKDIPNFIDALFETVSGFTTTGASILPAVEDISHASIFWRSFTHWIGGMGVIVFLLAILPSTGGYDMHLMRAESPGPSVGKLVPRIRDTALYLYGIYIAMTIVQIILLLFAKMPLFDTITITFGTAGTGGFGIKNDSMASYSPLIQNIVTVFMILFGVNFNAYFILFLSKHKKDIFKQEEVKTYFSIIFVAIAIISINILSIYNGDILTSIKHAAFQVGSIITTTGYSTTDFNVWPELSRTILVMLMFIGACAGSTGGGIKVSRIIILIKSMFRDIQKYIHPNSVKCIRLDRKTVDSNTVKAVNTFLATYFIIYSIIMLILAFDKFDLITNFTAIAATFNNIGPGLELVGPMGNFAMFSPISKVALTFGMLAGRLELYPMLIILVPSMWKISKVKGK